MKYNTSFLYIEIFYEMHYHHDVNKQDIYNASFFLLKQMETDKGLQKFFQQSHFHIFMLCLKHVQPVHFGQLLLNQSCTKSFSSIKSWVRFPISIRFLDIFFSQIGIPDIYCVIELCHVFGMGSSIKMRFPGSWQNWCRSFKIMG